MGLIKAFVGAAEGTLADQWKEFFYCDAMDKSVMVKKGQKRTGARSSNVHGNDNIISNGSGIAVADGQCMIIVDRERWSRYVQSLDNLPMIHRQSRVFFQEVLETASRRHLRQSASVLHLAAIQVRISESTISIQRS